MDLNHLKQKLTGQKIADPILVALVILLLVIGYFYLFPSQKKDDPKREFLDKVESKIQKDEERAMDAQERFSEKMSRQAKNFEETQAIQEEKKKREFAERKFQELQERVEAQRERFPSERFLEEIQVKSYFAPITEESASAEVSVTEPRVASIPQPEKIRKEKGESLNRVEIRAGTWIPVILNHEIRGHLTGFGRGTIRQDVYDVTGAHVVIPQGAVVTLEMVKDSDYFVSALVAKQILLPNGNTVDLPLVGHDAKGAGGLDPRKSGKMKRHLAQKIGLTSLIAAISSVPQLLTNDNDDVGTLAQLSFVEKTSQDLGSVLKDALSLPTEKVLNAGAHINLLVVDSIMMPPYRAVFANTSANGYEAELQELKERLFQYGGAFKPGNLQQEIRQELQNSLREGGN